MEEEILEKIKYLKKHIPEIKSEKTRKQQLKYMHRLIKQINTYNFYRRSYESSNK